MMPWNAYSLSPDPVTLILAMILFIVLFPLLLVRIIQHVSRRYSPLSTHHTLRRSKRSGESAKRMRIV